MGEWRGMVSDGQLKGRKQRQIIKERKGRKEIRSPGGPDPQVNWLEICRVGRAVKKVGRVVGAPSAAGTERVIG